MAADHFVPQQMIRRFAGADGGLWELHKPSLRLGTKPRRPKGILFGDDYYTDVAGNLDEELLKRVEQNFARYYGMFADDDLSSAVTDGDAGAALVDWLASLLSRTSLVMAQGVQVAMKHQPAMVLPMVALRNETRRQWYGQMQDLMTRPEWKWRTLTIRDERTVVLTDNPVILTRTQGADGFVLIAPLSDKRVLFGGRAADIDGFRGVEIEQVNLHLAAWAESRVYSSDTGVLGRILDALRADTNWGHQARRPFFGHVERIQDMAGPVGDEAGQFWERMLESYGSSVFGCADDEAGL